MRALSVRRFEYRGRRAFTLIELLVVISIISLLISILLPALSGARRSGQRVACMGCLRPIAQGVAAYATDNNDWMIGAPGGSGGYIPSGAQVGFGPAVQRWDFLGPMATMLGVSLTESDGDPQRTARRFNDIRTSPAFLCRSNSFLSLYYAGPNAGTNRMVSYNTTRYPLFIRGTADEAGFPADGDGLSWYTNSHEERLPMDWKPVIGRVGVPSNKIYCGDGSIFTTSNGTDGQKGPDYDLSANGQWGGAFSSPGAYSAYSRSWDRGHAPGNGYDTGKVDARAYGFRHSPSANVKVGAKADAYKGNFVFLDGHAETLGDLQASNPNLWLPQGTELGPASTQPDVLAHWNITGTIRIGP